MAIPNQGDKHDKRVVLATYADYDARCTEYRFLRDAYTGGGGFAPWLGRFDGDTGYTSESVQTYTYLRRYVREPSKKWERRVKNSYYPNYLKWVINIWVGLMTRETPARNEYPDQMIEWLDSVTPSGKSYNQVVADIYFAWWLVYGEMWAVLGRPIIDGTPVSAAQATNDLYLSAVHPDRIMDYSRDEYGRLIYVKYSTDMPASIDPLNPGIGDGQRVWVLTREGWWCYDVPTRPPSEIPVTAAGLWDPAVRGAVPMAQFKADDYPQSPTYYLAQTMLRLFNVLSMLGEIEDLSCFPVLGWPCRSPDELKKIDWGSATAIPYPAEYNSTPAYVSYDAAPLEHLVNRASTLVEEAKRLSALVMDQSTGDSGVAKAYSFLQTDRTVVSFVSGLEMFELQICKLAAPWLGIAGGMPPDADPAYPRSFDVQEVSEALAAAQTLLDMQVGPVTTRLTKRFAISKVHQNLTADNWREIDRELDEEQTGEGMDAQETAPDDDDRAPPKPRVEIDAR